MSKIKSILRDKALERARRLRPVEVSKLPDPFTLKERTTLGAYSYALQVSKVRLLAAPALLDLEEGVKETPSAIARDYLITSYKRGPKILHEQAVKIGAYDEGESLAKKYLKPYPLFAKPGLFDHGLYIDIAATFWNIVNIAGWNLDYYPNKWLSPGRPPIDFPFPDHKEARSCLISVARPGWGSAYVPGGKPPVVPYKPGSPIINLSISKLISDILNSIAFEAVRLGAIYANTDGYIAPDEKTAAYICQMILDWGLEPRIKSEGAGGVKSTGAYKVGRDISIPYTLRGRNESANLIYPPVYKDWLQPRFAKLSALRIDKT